MELAPLVLFLSSIFSNVHQLGYILVSNESIPLTSPSIKYAKQILHDKFTTFNEINKLILRSSKIYSQQSGKGPPHLLAVYLKNGFQRSH